MKFCIIIPNYNHVSVIAEVIQSLSVLQLPIIMVNDASTPSAAQVMRDLATRTPLLELLEHEHNQGKGGAVQTGLLAAYARGYSHAIQVDADGQHNLADITTLMAMAAQFPQAVVSGQPVYDESVPKLRLYSRYLTHVWVWIETLSFAIRDSMCGFRCYPLAVTAPLCQQVKLGKRMDFDIEVLVRLYWRGTDIRFIATKVIYPDGGVSHFRALEDNLRISWLHTRLFFGMLLRLPKLLVRKFSWR